MKLSKIILLFMLRVFLVHSIDESINTNDSRLQVASKAKEEYISIKKSDDNVNIILKAKNEKGINSALNIAQKIENVKGKSGIMGMTVTKEDYKRLQENKDIDVVELNYEYQSFIESKNQVRIRKLRDELIPYGIEQVLQDLDFWNSVSPTGTVKICVGDTGYDLGHIDLPDGKDVIGSNNINIDEDWFFDGSGHGTHVSGTVAALGNGDGVMGVIPNNNGGNFELVIAKALDQSGSASSLDVLEGVLTCVENGAQVISLSLGCAGCYSSLLEEAYNELYQQGILLVAAAGNAGNFFKSYPASFDSFISVGALDSSKEVAFFSQFNDQVELSAPGVDILSTLPNDRFSSLSGTSMSTPHVSAVASLLWMHFPSCSNFQIRRVLSLSAEDVEAQGCDEDTGAGLVSAKSAYDILSKEFCDKDEFHSTAVGGCRQSLFCISDSTCEDGDLCTVNSCINGLCKTEVLCSECSLPHTFTVDIFTDFFSDETTWDLKNSQGDTIIEQGPFGIRMFQFSNTICLEDDSYKFTIHDSFADGLCCALGIAGGYVLTVNETQIASGSSFTFNETVVFDLSPSLSNDSLSPTGSSTLSLQIAEPTSSTTLRPNSLLTSMPTLLPTSTPTVEPTFFFTSSPTYNPTKKPKRKGKKKAKKRKKNRNGNNME